MWVQPPRSQTCDVRLLCAIPPLNNHIEQTIGVANHTLGGLIYLVPSLARITLSILHGHLLNKYEPRRALRLVANGFDGAPRHLHQAGQLLLQARVHDLDQHLQGARDDPAGAWRAHSTSGTHGGSTDWGPFNLWDKRPMLRYTSPLEYHFISSTKS